MYPRSTQKAKLANLQGIVGIAILIVAGVAMLSAAAYQMIAYIRLPADLLSFAESSFVNDILKFRLNMPLYTPPADNNSYPYMPGAPILTYLIAALFGRPDSIPVYRAVQFSYVILAAVLATSVADMLARKFLTQEEYRYRPLWIVAWLPFLLLAAIDARFNAFNHSLHNDGLALLISVAAFWVIVRHSLGPKNWHLVFMAILPAAGFLVKQSLLIWIGIFPFYLLFSGLASRKQILSVLLSSSLLAGGVIALCYALWGDNYVWWIFQALGDKEISPARSLLNLAGAGVYAAFGLVAGLVLVLRRPARDALTLWLVWLGLVVLEAYTSGIGWNVNHLGPGVVLATAWFLTAIAKLWPQPKSEQAVWQSGAHQVVAASVLVLLLAGGMGPVRGPVNPVPADMDRYIQAIESEFEDLPADKVLLDSGTWVYLKDGIVMKDRAWAVSLHNGENQPINHALLSETIDRIQRKTYDRILAHELDTPENWYDYHDRGSGVKDAIFDNYHVVRRIPAVTGINAWSSISLVSEILVLEPNRN